MTQTLKRELRLLLEKELSGRLLVERECSDLCELLASEILSLAGIAKIGRSAAWDLSHGLPIELTDADKNAALYKSISERLEVGLKRNMFPQSTAAQKVYRWIADQEEKGESLDRFIEWAMAGKRAEFSYVYHKDPALIRRDWPQAITAQPEKAERHIPTLVRE